MAIIHKIGRIPNKIIVIKITEGKVIIGNREVDLITGEIIREAEVITKMTRDRIVGAEAMEGVAAMNKVKTIIGQTISVEEGRGSFRRPWRAHRTYQRGRGFTLSGTGDHNTKGSCNINIYVVSVMAEGIMIISVIPFNICFMLCNNKVSNKCHNPTLITIILIKLINRLFKAGIPQPYLYIRQ